MRVVAATTSDGVCEEEFTLGDVPGVLWSPAVAAGGRPLVLLGHGGGQHKKGPGLVARARRLVTGCGFAAAAIDMPGYGGRPRSEQDERFLADIAARRAAIPPEPVAELILRHSVTVAARAVPEWLAVLDALADAGYTGPVGYWGVSLGTLTGLPLVAAEPRIRAAVFGLAPGEILAEAAARIVVDWCFAVIRGHRDTPDQPLSPDQPRKWGGRG
jgi:pimeloyl-ACP methyl ester carboxylesterase